METIERITKWFIHDSCDLYWLDVFLSLEIISNFISLLNYKYQFVPFKFYIGWNSFTWGLPTYILLRLSIHIIGKIAETKLIFFSWKEYSLEKYSTKSIFLFVYNLSYDLQTYIKQSASYVTITDQFQVKDKSRVFQDKYLISYTHLRNDK